MPVPRLPDPKTVGQLLETPGEIGQFVSRFGGLLGALRRVLTHVSTSRAD